VGFLTKEVDPNVFNGSLHSVEAGSFAFGVNLVDEFVNLTLVRLEPWVNVDLVEVDRALFAWHDEVEVQTETHPGVEGYPVEDEVEVRLNQQEQRESHPVHQPWRKIGGVTSTDSFVGGVDGKED